MNIALPTKRTGFRELQRVRLLGLYTSDHITLRPGATGTIVHRYRGGEAFEVEFTSPAGTVITLKPDEIAAADG